MSKRINQRINQNGTINTFTNGRTEGNLPNFDVFVETPPRNFKKSTEMLVSIGNGLTLNLDGRQARTLNEVLSRHFDQVDQ